MAIAAGHPRALLIIRLHLFFSPKDTGSRAPFSSFEVLIQDFKHYCVSFFFSFLCFFLLFFFSAKRNPLTGQQVLRAISRLSHSAWELTPAADPQLFGVSSQHRLAVKNWSVNVCLLVDLEQKKKSSNRACEGTI